VVRNDAVSVPAPDRSASRRPYGRAALSSEEIERLRRVLGTEVQRARSSASLSQEGLAACCALQPATLRGIERCEARTLPKLTTLIALSRATNAPLVALIGATDLL
jgi:ribosome-binding protein aMBF1 (putative translation factor)